MTHQQFVEDFETGWLCCCIKIPAALGMLFSQKKWTKPVQLFFLKWFCALIAVLIAAAYLLRHTPLFWAILGMVIALFSLWLILWVGTGDIFLNFALRDARFFEEAMRRQVLSFSMDGEASLPQPGTNATFVEKDKPSELTARYEVAPRPTTFALVPLAIVTAHGARKKHRWRSPP